MAGQADFPRKARCCSRWTPTATAIWKCAGRGRDTTGAGRNALFAVRPNGARLFGSSHVLTVLDRRPLPVMAGCRSPTHRASRCRRAAGRYRLLLCRGDHLPGRTRSRHAGGPSVAAAGETRSCRRGARWPANLPGGRDHPAGDAGLDPPQWSTWGAPMAGSTPSVSTAPCGPRPSRHWPEGFAAGWRPARRRRSFAARLHRLRTASRAAILVAAGGDGDLAIRLRDRLRLDAATVGDGARGLAPAHRTPRGFSRISCGSISGRGSRRRAIASPARSRGARHAGPLWAHCVNGEAHPGLGRSFGDTW